MHRFSPDFLYSVEALEPKIETRLPVRECAYSWACWLRWACTPPNVTYLLSGWLPKLVALFLLYDRQSRAWWWSPPLSWMSRSCLPHPACGWIHTGSPAPSVTGNSLICETDKQTALYQKDDHCSMPANDYWLLLESPRLRFIGWMWHKWSAARQNIESRNSSVQSMASTRCNMYTFTGNC